MTTASGHTTAICSKKVIGTNVKDLSGSKIGEVEDLVLDKISGNVLFAVIGFGGVMGVGEKFHPIPWNTLYYDKDKESYVLDITKEQLQAAPADSIHELTRNDGMAYRNRAHDYYNASTARTW